MAGESFLQLGYEGLVSGEGIEAGVIKGGGEKVVGLLLPAGKEFRDGLAKRCQLGFFLALLFRDGSVRLIEDLETGDGLLDCGANLRAALEPEFVFGQGFGIAFSLEPAAGAFASDHFGEGLVEGRLVLLVILVMGELVKDEFGEVDFGIVDEGVENGVVEKAQGRVGVDPAHEGVESLGLELADQLLRVLFLEVSAIVLGADDEIPPSLGFEGVFGGGVDDVDDVITLEVAVVAVRTGGVEVEFAFREIDKLLAESKLSRKFGFGGRIGDDGGDFSPSEGDFGLATGGLGVKRN